MEDLPEEYTEHNLPLVFLSGLRDEDTDKIRLSARRRQESGTRITSEHPLCRPDRAQAVLQQFLAWDGTQLPWNAISLPGPPGLMKYHFRALGRNFTLPPRKAAPLAQSPTSETVPVRQVSSELHSPLSPLSPGSPVFPDGIMTPLWFAKHQAQVPSLIIVFYDFTHDGGAKEDDLIKAEINTVKTALSRSGFRVRLAAVLMSDRSIVQSAEMEERFAAIRRATSLDSKSGLFFMPPMPSEGEIATFAQSTVTTLQPLCVEYYRELTKHARRKKSRSSIPMSPNILMRGASQSLHTPGWNARYETKQGLFAEYRQEMDVAERHYSQAIEDLCSTEGVFESLPVWSPRWDETRLLCDSIAARIIRCHLWNGLTTAAVQAWFDHRKRMTNLINAKGKGTHTYGWLAWKVRWARIMAQLIQLAEVPMLDGLAKTKNEPPVDLNEYHAYSRPEKPALGADMAFPFLHLHHPGYWNRLALRLARLRHESALSIQEEDRIPPGQSPASSVANRAQAYDTYLVPEPHQEYANAKDNGMVNNLQLLQLHDQAHHELLNKGQRRMAEQLDVELAADLVKEQLYAQAMQILVPLWHAATWREEQWYQLLGRLLNLLSQCSVAVENAEIALATAWEQYSISMKVMDLESSQSLTQTLESLDLARGAKISLEFSNVERLSPLRVSFSFDEVDAFAGEPLRCQLNITSSAPIGTQPIQITELKLAIAGLGDVYIRAEDGTTEKSSTSDIGSDATSKSSISEIGLNATEAGLEGSASLSNAPQRSHTYDFMVTCKAAGAISLTSLMIKIEGESFKIVHTIDDPQLLQAAYIYAIEDGLPIARDARAENTTTKIILPKPPKVDIRIQDLEDYYTVGETLDLTILVTNHESQSVSGDLSHKLSLQAEGIRAESHIYKLGTDEDLPPVEELASTASFEAVLHIPGVQVTTELLLVVAFSYKLVDGSQTKLVKELEMTIPLKPFLEPRWSFGPLIHSQPWPSYFDANVEESSENPSGIPQRWRASFTAHKMRPGIVLDSSSLQLQQSPADAACEIQSNTDEPEATVKGKTVSRNFDLTTRKIMFDDRRPTQLTLACSVTWSHEGDTKKHTSPVAVPRITLPSSEPRVLCTVTQDEPGSAVILQYFLENLSTHFLTFTLTMEANDEFAFSGAKYRTLSLAPLSRMCVSYRLVLHRLPDVQTTGCWIWPDLQVVDSYYQKTLRVQPASEDVKLDSHKGIGVFVRNAIV